MRRSLCAGVIAMLLLLCAAVANPTLAQSRAVSLEGYWGVLTRLRAAVADDHAGLAELKSELEAIDSVQLPDGRQLPLENTFLLAQLKGIDDDQDAVLQLIDTLLAERTVELRTSRDSEAAAALQAILARSEFAAEPPPSRLQQIWQDFVRSVQRLVFYLSDLLSGVGRGGGSLIGWLVMGVAGLILIGVLLYWGVRLRGQFVDSAQQPLFGADEADMNADEALQRAQRAATQSDYRSGVRYLYLSALLLLDERDLLRFDRSRTNREYVKSVRRSADLYPIVRNLVDVFDRVWYGFEPVGSAEFDYYAATVDQLRQRFRISD